MSQIKVFENPVFGSIRTVIRDEQAWFVVADVSRALEITNPSDVIGRLDSDEKNNTLVSNEGIRINRYRREVGCCATAL